MITLLGDIHGDIRVLRNAIAEAEDEGTAALIQVGDFGLMQDDGNDTGFYHACKNAKLPVYFIDGNHDDCTRWTGLTEVTRIWDDANLYYIPRGMVMEIDGRTLAFMGGAASIDKGYRISNNWHWDENENISPYEVLRMMDNAKDKNIDMFITHCPPDTVVSEHFDPLNKLQFGVGLDWHDHNQDIIENIWHALGTPMIYSGHMHRKVEGMTYRILDINERIKV